MVDSTSETVVAPTGEPVLSLAPGAAPFRWGAVLAGFFLIAALQIVLQLLGVAVGISAVHPALHSAETMSIWSAAWIGLSTLSAFFFGGWLAAAASPADRRAALVRGLTVWAFGTTVGVLFVTLGLGGAVSVARALLLPGRGRMPEGSPFAIGAAWASFGTIALSLVCSITGARLGALSPVRRRRVALPPRPAVPAPALP